MSVGLSMGRNPCAAKLLVSMLYSFKEMELLKKFTASNDEKDIF